jgi:hypothetical protein
MLHQRFLPEAACRRYRGIVHSNISQIQPPGGGDVVPFARLAMIEAASIALAIVAGITGGLISRNWVWAVACAVVVYGLASAATLVWLARQFRSGREWIDLDDDWPG